VPEEHGHEKRRGSFVYLRVLCVLSIFTALTTKDTKVHKRRTLANSAASAYSTNMQSP